MELTAEHGLVLAWLRAHPDATAQQIADGLGADHEAVVQLCAELEREGFITLAPFGTA